MTEIEYRRGVHLFGGYGSERYRWHLYIGSLCVGEMVGTIEDMDKRLAEIRAEIGATPDPTPAILDVAAAQIEAAMGEDMQEAADVLTVWEFLKENAGDITAYRVVLGVYENDEKLIWKIAKTFSVWQDGDDWLHQAAEWCRQQQEPQP